MNSISGGDSQEESGNISFRDRRFITSLAKQTLYQPENIILPAYIRQEVELLRSVEPFDVESSSTGVIALKDNLTTTKSFMILTTQQIASMLSTIQAIDTDVDDLGDKIVDIEADITNLTTGTVPQDMLDEYNRQMLKKTIAKVIDQDKRGIEAIQSSIDWLNKNIENMVKEGLKKLAQKISEIFGSEDLKAGDIESADDLNDLFTGSLKEAGSIAASAGQGYALSQLGPALAGGLALFGGIAGLQALSKMTKDNNDNITILGNTEDLTALKAWYEDIKHYENYFGYKLSSTIIANYRALLQLSTDFYDFLEGYNSSPSLEAINNSIGELLLADINNKNLLDLKDAELQLKIDNITDKIDYIYPSTRAVVELLNTSDLTDQQYAANIITKFGQLLTQLDTLKYVSTDGQTTKDWLAIIHEQQELYQVKLYQIPQKWASIIATIDNYDILKGNFDAYVEEATIDIDQSKQNVELLQTQVGIVATELGNLINRVNTIEPDITVLKDKANTTTASIGGLQLQVDSINTSVADLQSSLNATNTNLNSAMQQLYDLYEPVRLDVSYFKDSAISVQQKLSLQNAPSINDYAYNVTFNLAQMVSDLNSLGTSLNSVAKIGQAIQQTATGTQLASYQLTIPKVLKALTQPLFRVTYARDYYNDNQAWAAGSTSMFPFGEGQQYVSSYSSNYPSTVFPLTATSYAKNNSIRITTRKIYDYFNGSDVVTALGYQPALYEMNDILKVDLKIRFTVLQVTDDQTYTNIFICASQPDQQITAANLRNYQLNYGDCKHGSVGGSNKFETIIETQSKKFIIMPYASDPVDGDAIDIQIWKYSPGVFRIKHLQVDIDVGITLA